MLIVIEETATNIPESFSILAIVCSVSIWACSSCGCISSRSACSLVTSSPVLSNCGSQKTAEYAVSIKRHSCFLQCTCVKITSVRHEKTLFFSFLPRTNFLYSRTYVYCTCTSCPGCSCVVCLCIALTSLLTHERKMLLLAPSCLPFSLPIFPSYLI